METITKQSASPRGAKRITPELEPSLKTYFRLRKNKSLIYDLKHPREQAVDLPGQDFYYNFYNKNIISNIEAARLSVR